MASPSKRELRQTAARIGALLLAGALSVAGGCGGRQKAATRLTMMVPCGIAEPIQEAARLFAQDNPGLRFDAISENAVVLVRKALSGEKADLFIAMGPREMDQLAAKQLIIPESRVDFAGNTIVVLVRADRPVAVASLSDLAKPEVKVIALPQPENNSAGYYGREALQKLGLWEQVQKKIVTPEFGVAVGSLVSGGKVDAGIIYRSCGQEEAAAEAPNTRVACEPSQEVAPYMPVPAAVMTGSKHRAQAEQFIRFLLTPRAQKVLTEYLFPAPK